jgi:predicted ATPase/DNA-binding winged helix-turn-helix (wHTH) protein
VGRRLPAWFKVGKCKGDKPVNLSNSVQSKMQNMREDQIVFSEFRLDPDSLWRGDKLIRLRPKTHALLQYLAERPGRLVTKDELLESLWPDTAVTDAVLKVCVSDIRRALSDDAEAPRFIETAHRRGYRFIGQPQAVEMRPSREAGWHTDRTLTAPLRSGSTPPTSPTAAGKVIVGREQALKQMNAWFEKALDGNRQVIFVTGEPGIGKTMLIEAFIRGFGDSDVLVACGQCLESYGAGEAYLPLLEAFGRLCRGARGEQVLRLLRTYAPTWLVQMPSLVSPDERDALSREIFGATPDRMLREMADAIDALADQTPLVLVIEDLHWSDYSTLDLLSALARRRERARLLVIASYRPVEVILNEHPMNAVKQELQMHKQAEELAVDFLTESAVSEYLNARFPGCRLQPQLASLVHQRTEGNPLFMVNVVDYLVAQRLIVEIDGEWTLQVALDELEVAVPDSIRQVIERQIERLTADEQRLLEVASLAAPEFSAVALASALEDDPVEIEEMCESITRRHCFLNSVGIGEWPDGTVSARYLFRHALYRSVLSQRIAPARRAQLHLKLGEQGVLAYGGSTDEIAAELAMHFEQGRAYRRAIKFLQQAAEKDSRRYANREALCHLDKALKLVERLPEPERPEMHMSLLEEQRLLRESMTHTIDVPEDFVELASGAQSAIMAAGA